MKTIMAMVVALFLGGCSVAGYDLSRLPEYDRVAANENWDSASTLGEIKAELDMMYMFTLLAGAEPTEVELEGMRRFYDELLYWKAVSEVQVFHSDYDASRASAEKAMAAAKKVGAIFTQMMDRIAVSKGI